MKKIAAVLLVLSLVVLSAFTTGASDDSLPVTGTLPDIFGFSTEHVLGGTFVFNNRLFSPIDSEEAKGIILYMSIYPLERVIRPLKDDELANYINIHTSEGDFLLLASSNSIVYGKYSGDNYVVYRTSGTVANQVVYGRINDTYSKYYSTAVSSDDCPAPVLPDRQCLTLPASWAAAEIDRAASRNLLPYELSGNYSAPVSREEFCLLTCQLIAGMYNPAVSSYRPDIEYALANYVKGRKMTAGLPAPKLFRDAEDFSGSQYSYSAHILQTLGIIDGRSNGTFDPKGIITREEAAKVLCLTSELYLKNSDDQIAASDRYSDHQDISFWAINYVEQATSQGLMRGNEKNEFLPNKALSREEAVVIVQRLYDMVQAPAAADEETADGYGLDLHAK